MTEQEQLASAFVVVGAWVTRVIVAWAAIIGTAAAAGVAWRLFGVIAG